MAPQEKRSWMTTQPQAVRSPMPSSGSGISTLTARRLSTPLPRWAQRAGRANNRASGWTGRCLSSGAGASPRARPPTKTPDRPRSVDHMSLPLEASLPANGIHNPPASEPPQQNVGLVRNVPFKGEESGSTVSTAPGPKESPSRWESPSAEPFDEGVWQTWLAKGRARERLGIATRAKAVKWFSIVVLLASVLLWPYLAPYEVGVRFVEAAAPPPKPR